MYGAHKICWSTKEFPICRSVAYFLTVHETLDKSGVIWCDKILSKLIWFRSYWSL